MCILKKRKKSFTETWDYYQQSVLRMCDNMGDNIFIWSTLPEKSDNLKNKFRKNIAEYRSDLIFLDKYC